MTGANTKKRNVWSLQFSLQVLMVAPAAAAPEGDAAAGGESFGFLRAIAQAFPAALENGTMRWLVLAVLALVVLALIVNVLLRVEVRRKTAQLSEQNTRLQQEIAERTRAEEAVRAAEQRLLEQNAALVALAREEVTSTDSTNPLPGLKRMLETACSTLQVARTSLWMFDEERTRITCLGLYQVSVGQHSEGMELAKTDFPAYFAAVEEDRILAADDAVNDPRTREFAENYLKPSGIGAMLDVPIRIGGRVVGVLCSEHVGGARDWQFDEQNFCKALADITALGLESAERRRVQDHLRRSERYYRSLIENTSDMIVILDEQGTMTYLSPSYYRILGYEAGDKIGTSCFELMHPDDVQEVQRVFSQLVQSGGDVEKASYRYQHRNGSWRHMEAVGKNLLQDDAVQAIVANVRDVTERVHAEQQLAVERASLEETVKARTDQLYQSLQKLKDANLRLEEASRHKSRFLSSMSHELRTPLNAILGFADLLRGQFFGPLNDKQLAYVNQLDQSGKHLLALINDLLDVAKIDAGAMEVAVERFSPRECIEAATNMLSSQFRAKQIELQINIAPDIFSMTGDLRKCRQIMLNLLSNALKYTPEKGRVEVRAERYDDAVQISVIDNGIGIAEADQKKLFSEFHQVNRTRDENLGGTGIGLALTRRLVELHGGQIGVKSAAGEGSTFWFTLPQQALQPQSDVALATLPEEVEGEAVPQADTTILVAEDNDVNLAVILDMLSTRGFQAIVARNGQEAVEMAEEHQPDLILMDIRMPVMDGLEATARIRSIGSISETPIVALTASAGSDSEERCLAAGCTAHLPKPVQTKELFELLEKYLPEMAE